jgi:hypothetical protein
MVLNNQKVATTGKWVKLHLFIQNIEAACIIGEAGDLISMS